MSAPGVKPIPFPIKVDPSKDWQGVDGPWSAFVVRMPETQQSFKVLPSTSLGQTWLISAKGCGNDTDTILAYNRPCRVSRGGLFNGTEASRNGTRYHTDGIQILTNYGFRDQQPTMWEDNMTFGYSSSDTSTPNRSFKIMMASTAGWEYTWLGFLGIDGRPTNLTDRGAQENPLQSLLESMKNSSTISSKSWGYTAGSYNRPLGGVAGSLILGGYDTNKFIDNDVRFPFNDDDELALTVALRSMTLSYSSQTPKSSKIFQQGQGIAALIDSNRPYMILPKEWCDDVAEALQLNWDKNSSHYLISDQLHSQLLATNPSLAFAISPMTSLNESVKITVPYSSLGLRLTYPRIPDPNGSYYFPMLPAQNPAQYTLGRAFMQDAYIISDYERKQFQVKEVHWDNAKFAQPNLVSIPPLEALPPPVKPGLGKAAIGGIVGGSVLLAALVVLFVILFRRAGYRIQRGPKLAIAKDVDDGSEHSELNSSRSPRSSNTPMSPGAMLEGKLLELDSGLVHESGGTAVLPPQEMGEMEISELPDMNGTLAGYYKEVELDSSELFVDGNTAASSKTSPETGASTLAGSARTKSTDSSGNTTPSNPATAAATLIDAGSPIPQTPAEFYGGRRLPGWRLADRKEAAVLRGHERGSAAARGEKSAPAPAAAGDDDGRPPASPIPQTPAEYYGRRAGDFRRAAKSAGAGGAAEKRPPGNGNLQVPATPAVPAARLAPPPRAQPPASPIPQTPAEYYGRGGRGPPRAAATVMEKRARNDALRVAGARGPAADDDDVDAILPASPLQQTPIEFYGRRRAFEWPPPPGSRSATLPSAAATAGQAATVGTATMAATSMTVGASSAERGWVGRAPDVPGLILTPPTPMSPSGGAAVDGRPAIVNEKRPPTKKGRREK